MLHLNISITILLFQVLSYASLATADNDNDNDYQVIGSFIFGRHNDRSAKPSTELTPLGAESQFNSGQFYRRRYFGLDALNNQISSSSSSSSDNGNVNSTKISSLNKYGFFKNGEIYCEAISSNVILFSHYSFLQGLYPPMEFDDDSSNYKTIANQSLAYVNNGTLIENPLHGYQYVNSYIQENATDDYIWIKGDENCPALDSVITKIKTENKQYIKLAEESAPFYQQLYKENSFIQENFAKLAMNFNKSMSIYDTVNVNVIHNSTVTQQFNDSTIAQIKSYADKYQWLISNHANNEDLALGAKSLMGRVLEKLNITKTQSKPALNYFTGSYNTMYQLASIIAINGTSDSFKTMPNYGATYVFELLNKTSTSSASDDSGQKSETFVRFLFRNGTDDATDQLIAYPIFNNTKTIISWDSFVNSVQQVSIDSVESWCSACGWTDSNSNSKSSSNAMLDMCVPFSSEYKAAETLKSSGVNLEELAKGDYDSVKSKIDTNGNNNQLTLAQAGGIGAGTTIGVFAIAGAVAFALVKLFKKNKSKGVSRAGSGNVQEGILPTTHSVGLTSINDGDEKGSSHGSSSV